MDQRSKVKCYKLIFEAAGGVREVTVYGKAARFQKLDELVDKMMKATWVTDYADAELTRRQSIRVDRVVQVIEMPDVDNKSH